MPTDSFAIIKELAAGGFATFLVALLVAGKYRIWVWGYHLDEMTKEKDARIDELIKEKDAQILYERMEKDQWRQLALETKEMTNRSVVLATKVVAGQA